MEVVVDAGHGGTDLGASGNGIVEKELALKISNYQYDRFKKLGIPVARTRSGDETLTPEERTKRVLNAFGNKASVIVISNHLSSGGGDGAEIVYALRNNDTLPRIMAEEFANSGQNVRKWYQRRLPFDPSQDYYFIIRDTGSTHPILIEYGFVDSSGDDANLLKDHWQDLAEAVVRAVAIFGNIPYDLAMPGTKYIVKSGDSLWSIAKKFEVSVTDLKQTNNLSANTLKVGQILTIPGTGTTPPTQTDYVNYTVKSGDSIWTIASDYDTTVDDIKKLNNLTTSSLKIGQILKVPTAQVIVEPEPGEPPYQPTEPSGNTYTVQRGDTLYSIANRFGVTATEIRNLNNLTSDVLTIGQVLLIPTTGTTPTPSQPTTIKYVVKKGDNLYSIASEYGTTADTIKTLNKLSTNLLNIGQELLVPVSGGYTAPTITTYIVKSGDSLWTIANKFGITVTQLRQLNNLTSDLLNVGQQLKIPA